MKAQNLFLKVFVPPLLLYFACIFFLVGKENSDTALNLFFVSFALFFMIIWGFISYNWKIKDKLALVLSLQAVFFLMLIINNLITG
jgi:ABC-type transport system involved in cytochrome bd biosynthesis fused ATPase/permease subunit